MTDQPHNIILAYRFKLKPTSKQHDNLRAALERSRQLYNAALQERIDCYRKTGKGRSYFDQCRALTELRKDGTPYAVVMERAPLKAVDDAYRAFFKRGGFPRFKGRNWFKCIGWPDRLGWQIKSGRFIAKGIGAIRIHMHREMRGEMKSCRIKRESRHWYLSIACEVECEAANDNPAIGIDMGLADLAILSDGTRIENVRPFVSAQKELRKAQRALARCKRGSRRRQKVRERLARKHQKIRRQRETYLHQVSAKLAKSFGTIAVEKLQVRNMVRNRALSKSIQDASWGRLRGLLQYKAELNGGQVIEVDPRGTSQACSGCGAIVPKTLKQRWHNCPHCGLSIDRDHNAAINILIAAVHSRTELNAAGCGERAPRKAAA